MKKPLTTMKFAVSRPGFTAYPHAVQYGIACARRAGGFRLSHTEFYEIQTRKAREFNADHSKAFCAMVEAAGGVNSGLLLGDPIYTLATRFGEWQVRFDGATSSITANFQTRDPALLQAASRATGSSDYNGKLGFYTDADTERVLQQFEAALRQVCPL